MNERLASQGIPMPGTSAESALQQCQVEEEEEEEQQQATTSVPKVFTCSAVYFSTSIPPERGR